MKVPKGQKAMVAAESLRRLCEAPLDDTDRYLLTECVEAYSDLDPSQKIVYDKVVQQKTYSKVRTMNKTTREKGIEEGLSKGLEQGLSKGLEQGLSKGLEQGLSKGLSLGQQKTFRNLLDSRFGPLPKKTVERIEKLSVAKIDELIPKLWGASSLKDLGL
jgi:flagellar biosynthesis/type III secretory pathway protein FliH